MSAPARCVDPFFATRLAAAVPAPDADTSVALMAQAALSKFTNVAGRSAKQLGDNAVPKIQNVTGHRDAPYANNNGAGSQEMSVTARDGTFRKPKTQPIVKEVAAQALSNTLREAYGQYQSKHKRIAQHAGIKSAKTAEAWSCGRNLPALEYFLELGRNSPAIQKMTMRLWGLDADIDPEYQRAFMDLLRVVNGR